MTSPFASADEALAFIRREEIGCGVPIETPFGQRRLCYADQTASGRFLGFVEQWIGHLRPYYANSHTLISTTGRLMTELREQSRAVIRRGVGASSDDIVIFVGSGATAAINKLVGILGLRQPQPAPRPLVLVGPYEHHSNELPWVESNAEVIEIGETPEGAIDLADLDARLAEGERTARFMIGSFSAASNVTGILSDVPAIARTLRRHGALVCFDFAACGPYVPINMHPTDPEAAIDAIFLSTHKFPGGPSGSGVLVASRRCFHRAVPDRPGGGTVQYVSRFGHYNIDYVVPLDEREEGGTPAILADIRAGIAMLVKEMVGAEALREHEIDVARIVLERLGRNPRIRFLGSTMLPRLPILSFNIEGLHHDFVAILLDHLFGIQNRAGCACAGPYGHRLLGVGAEASAAFRAWILRGILGIKPGWVRVTIPSYAQPRDIEFILRAIEFVADRGADFLPAYRLDWHDGVWRHLSWQGQEPEPEFRLTLDSLLALAAAPQAVTLEEAVLETERARYFAEAHAAADSLVDAAGRAPSNPGTGSPELDRLIWFRYLHASHLPSAERMPLLPILSD